LLALRLLREDAGTLVINFNRCQVRSYAVKGSQLRNSVPGTDVALMYGTDD
jgi:hypothetical protein